MGFIPERLLMMMIFIGPGLGGGMVTAGRRTEVRQAGTSGVCGAQPPQQCFFLVLGHLMIYYFTGGGGLKLNSTDFAEIVC